ncbi:MAG TPA: hypothetical protein VKA10_09545 [Prolixibacteraceae bacterium]|nr:hypothetical protein [Prolixibacteraceae bacterium]
MKNHITKNHELSHTNPTHNNFELLGNALSELKSGTGKAIFEYDRDLNRGDEFLTTFTFPITIFELPQLANKQKMWQVILAVIPHLFQKQKVLYLKPGTTVNAKIADKLYRNRADKKFIPLKSLHDFSFIKNKNQQALLFQEYRFNFSRFFIETLKNFKKNGGTIRFKNEKNTAENVNKQAILIPVKTYPNFEFVVKDNKSVIRFYQKDDKILATAVNEKPFTLTASMLIDVAANYFTFNPDLVQTILVRSTPSVQTIFNSIENTNKSFSCSFENTLLDDYYEIGLEKFDLAKQTGIAYEDFKVIFHRYGKGIDEITEFAYQQMEKTRDVAAAWELAEGEYHEKYEWKDRVK